MGSCGVGHRRVAGLSDLPADFLRIDLLQVRRNGLTLNDTFAGPGWTEVGINPVLLAIQDIEVALNVNVNVSTAPNVTGTVTVGAARGIFFPNGESTIVAEVTGLNGSLDLAAPTDSLELRAAGLDVTLGELLSIDADDVLLDLDGDPVVTVAAANLLPSVPGLEALGVVSLTGTGITIGRSNLVIESLTAHVDGPVAAPGLFSASGIDVTVSNLSVEYAAGAQVGSVEVTFDSVDLFDGLATLAPKETSGHAVTGTFDTQGNTIWTFGKLTAQVDGLVEVEAADGSFAFGPASTAPLLTVPTAYVKLPLMGGTIGLEAVSLELTRGGDFLLDSAALRSDGLLKTLGWSGILPFDVTTVTMSGLDGEPIRLGRFALQMEGVFDLSVFDFAGVEPALTIGAINVADGAVFSLGFRVQEGSMTVLIDDGPLVVGLENLAFGPVEIDAFITLGEFVDHAYRFQNLGAELSVTVAGETIEASMHNVTLVQENGITTLDLAAALGFSVARAVGAASVLIENFSGQFHVTLAVDENLNPVAPPTGLSLQGASAQRVEIAFGDLLLFSADGPTLDLSGEYFLQFDGLTASFPLIPFLGETTGTVSNFAVKQDFSFVALPGFGVLFENLPDAEALGLPDWLPVTVTGLGIELGRGALDGTDLSDIRLIVSGGLIPVDPWPFEGTVQNLPVNLKKLAEGEGIGALEPPEGFFIGVEPIELSDALRIGGGIGLGVVEHNGTKKLYGRLKGYFELEGIGAGIELIITELGPLVAAVQAPLAVPLGPSGILLSGVGGGFAFGVEPVDVPPTPVDLLRDPMVFDPLDFSLQGIEQAIRDALDRGKNTWNLPFRLMLDADFTTVASPGIAGGHLTIAATVDGTKLHGELGVPLIQFLGSGDIGVFGMPIGGVGMLLDFTDPLAPTYDLAFAAPVPGSPLAFLLPASGEFGLRLDTEGMAEALAIGFKTFVTNLSEDNEVLNRVAEALQSDRSRSLSLLILEGHEGAQITAVFFRERMLEILGDTWEWTSGQAGRISERVVRAVNAALSVFMEKAAAWVDGGTAFLDQLSTTLRDATLDALRSGFDAFNPEITITGKLQPTILGVPFGQPTESIGLTLNKNGIGFSLRTSPLVGTAERLSLMIGNIGPLLVSLGTNGFKDYVELDFRLALDDVFGSLLGRSTLPEINPMGDWLVGISGSLTWLGFEVGEISGYLFSPQSEVFSDHVFVLPPGGELASDETRIPVADQASFDAIHALGGILLTGRLNAPWLLTDTPAVIDAIGLPPEVTDPSDLEQLNQLKEWLEGAVVQLTTQEEFARMQLYIPSFSSAIEGTTTDEGIFELNIINEEKLEELVNAAYLKGFLQAKMLGVELGRATAEMSPEGIAVAVEHPWLGTEVRFDLRQQEIDITSVLEEILGKELVGQDPLWIQVPVAGVTAGLNADNLRAFLTDRLGLPAAIFPVEAGASLEIYSPGYGDADSLERSGGIRFDAALDVKDLIDNARFHFEMPLFSGDPGSPLPDFIATGSLNSWVLPGVDVSFLSLRDVSLELSRVGGVTSFGFTGTANVLDNTFLAQGDLVVLIVPEDTGLYGSIALTAAAGAEQLVNPHFSINGDLTLRINTTAAERDGIPRGISVHADGDLHVLGLAYGVDIEGAFDLILGRSGISMKAGSAADPVRLAADLGTFGNLSFQTYGDLAFTGSGLYGTLSASGSGSTLGGDALPFELGGTFGLAFDTRVPSLSLSVVNGLMGINGLGLVAGGISLSGDFAINVTAGQLAVAVGASADPAHLSIGLLGLDATLGLDMTGQLTVLGTGVGSGGMMGGLFGSLQTTSNAGFSKGFFSLSGSFGVEVNTTNQSQGNLPAGPYLGMTLRGMVSAFSRALILWADPFEISVRPNELRFTAAATLGINAGPLHDSWTVDASGRLIGGQIEGAFSSGIIQARLDRFGWIEGSVADVPFGFLLPGGTRIQHVYIDDVWIEETDANRTLSIPVYLSRDAERVLDVSYTLTGGSAVHGTDWLGSSGTLTIAKGERRGIINVTVLGDNLDRGDRRFSVQITGANYLPDGWWDLLPPSVADDRDSATITILEDDRPLPVVVKLPDAPLVITEGNTGSFEIWAENLAAEDSVRISYTLAPRAASLGTATAGEDFRPVSGILTLRGSDRRIIPVITYPDTVYEIDESFELKFMIERPAAMAPATVLERNIYSINILNDDTDRREQALVFYDFDDLVNGNYVYDTGPDVWLQGGWIKPQPAVVASDFSHRDDTPNRGLSFVESNDHVIAAPRLGDPALPSAGFTLDFWFRPALYSTSTRQVLTTIGENLASIYLEGGNIYLTGKRGTSTFTANLGSFSAGQWHHVAVVHSTVFSGLLRGYVNGVLVFSQTSTGVLDLSPANQFIIGNSASLDRGFAGVIDNFHLWSKPLTDTEARALKSRITTAGESGLFLEYLFDEGQGDIIHNRSASGWSASRGSEIIISGTLTKTLTTRYGRPDWVKIEESASVPNIGAGLTASMQSLEGMPKVLPVDPESAATHAIQASGWWVPAGQESPYFHFTVGNDSPVIDRMVKGGQPLQITGVEFYDRADLFAGPTNWELRWSKDDFQSVLASGETSQTTYGFLRQVEAFSESLWVMPGDTVEFRLYGLSIYEAEPPLGGTWILDNFSLIGAVGSTGSAPVAPAVVLNAPIAFGYTEINVLSGVTDPEGDVIFMLGIKAPEGGTLTSLADGSWRIWTTEGTVLVKPGDGPGKYLIQPQAGVSGDVPVLFTLADDWLNTTDRVVTVHPLGVMWPDLYRTKPLVPVSGNVLANDTLVVGQSVKAELVQGTTTGSLLFNPDGTFTYTPAGNSPHFEYFHYKVTGVDMLQGSHYVEIYINDVPAAPARTYTVAEDGTLSVAAPGLLLGLKDAQGDTLSAYQGSGPAHGTLTIDSKYGSFIYKPGRDYNGTDTFTYRVTDGTDWSAPATVTITVTPVNDAPVGNKDAYSTNEGVALAVGRLNGVLSNDKDIDGDSLTAQLIYNPGSGTLSYFNSDGSFRYVPNAGFSGTDSFVYRASDGKLLSGNTTVSITVVTNNPPAAVNDSFTINEDNPITINLSTLLANDSDPDGHAITFNRISVWSKYGSLTEVKDKITGVLTGYRYVPNANYYGSDSFTYEIKDAYGKTATARADIKILAVNDAPTVVNQSYSLNIGASSTLAVAATGVLTGAKDVEGHQLSAVLVTAPKNAGAFTLNKDGSFTYTPISGFTGTDSFTFQARDAFDALSATATATIEVVKLSTLSTTTTRLIRGYVDDAVVFLDANHNRVADDGEPMILTGRDGIGIMEIPAVYDLDDNGSIEPMEGVLVARGGVQPASAQTLSLPFIAPVGASMITPLTTLLTTLILEQGYTMEDAGERLVEILALPDVDLLSFDPIAMSAAGEGEGPEVLARHVAIFNLHLGIGAFIAGETGIRLEEAGAALSLQPWIGASNNCLNRLCAWRQWLSTCAYHRHTRRSDRFTGQRPFPFP
ncbi:MAG: Ig-like domain-containing protein [Bacteroidales bacterium]